MIYLDNAATTKQNESSLKVFNEFALTRYFNSSSIYANENAVFLEQARKTILSKLNGDLFSSIIFTGSATEANNLVLNSFKDNIIISNGEHPSVYNFAQDMLLKGKNIKFCPLQTNGEIDYNALQNLIDKNTSLISVIHVNNETGAINDLKRITEIKNSICPNAFLHSDGVQAFCKIKTDVNDLGVDFYTMSAHKIGGPKGVGALYAKNKNKLKTLIFGGGQEFNLRSGTENLPGIMSFAEVVKLSNNNLQKIQSLKDNLIEQLTEEGIVINSFLGSPYILSVVFSNVNGETLVNILKTKGVFVSRGSACSSKKAGNRVLKECGLNDNQIKSTIRISFFDSNSIKEVIEAGKIINDSYKQLKEKLF